MDLKQKAGVVLYRRAEDKIEVLLISSRKYPGTWVFPVGTVDAGESLPEAARRECREESGCLAETGPQLGVVQDYKNQFTFFLAELVGKVEDYEQDRELRWVPLGGLQGALPEIFKPIAIAAVTRLSKG